MKLDPKKTAVLTLDLQEGIFSRDRSYERVLPYAAKLVAFAREKSFRIIHVGLGFSPGHPEISDKNVMFSQVKQNNFFLKGTPSTQFHHSVLQPDDLIIYKHRVSAFTENDLNLVLRSSGIENLVISGIASSGIVLSTVTQAFDLDYGLTVIEDACADPDADLHTALMTKVFSKRGSVMTVDAFMSQQK